MIETRTDDKREVRLAKRGLVTLPKDWRDRYDLEDGATLTLLDLGGAFMLLPGRSEVDRIANRLRDRLESSGESLESMLLAIREERARYDA